jgi:sugar phosphate isomerase/epimerase
MRQITFSLLIVLLSTVFISCSSNQEVQKEIGLQLWSVRQDMRTEPVGTLEQIGEMGYSFIEAAGYADGKFYGMDPVEFKNLANEKGLDFLASHTGKALPGEEEWDETMAWWDECIDAHVAAGVTYLVQPFMCEKGYGSIEDLQRYVDYFNLVGEKCNAKGIKFGYHNHDGEFEEIEGGITRYDFMLQNTDPDKVFFQIDLYWIEVGGKDAVDFFNRYPGRFDLWHVKDYEEIGASGKIDFERFFAATDVAGVDHIIVEVEQYNFEPIVSVDKSLQFLMEADYVK